MQRPLGHGLPEVASRLARVVEAHHRRPPARAHHVPDGLEAVARSCAKWKARPSLRSGSGRSENVTSVTTPSVPSLPRKSWRRSGPAAARGVSRVRSREPSGSTTSSASTRSSMFP